jgi:hypothetical protein
MRARSPVSRHSQIIASTDTSGNDAIKAPKPGLRRAISEINATRTPDNAAFRIR